VNLPEIGRMQMEPQRLDDIRRYLRPGAVIGALLAPLSVGRAPCNEPIAAET
jgi:hypothetical protein